MSEEKTGKPQWESSSHVAPAPLGMVHLPETSALQTIFFCSVLDGGGVVSQALINKILRNHSKECLTSVFRLHGPRGKISMEQVEVYWDGTCRLQTLVCI